MLHIYVCVSDNLAYRDKVRTSVLFFQPIKDTTWQDKVFHETHLSDYKLTNFHILQWQASCWNALLWAWLCLTDTEHIEQKTPPLCVWGPTSCVFSCSVTTVLTVDVLSHFFTAASNEATLHTCVTSLCVLPEDASVAGHTCKGWQQNSKWFSPINYKKNRNCFTLQALRHSMIIMWRERLRSDMQLTGLEKSNQARAVCVMPSNNHMTMSHFSRLIWFEFPLTFLCVFHLLGQQNLFLKPFKIN